jgi:hypothetical protein
MALPEHIFSLRSLVNLPFNFEFDGTYYYVDDVPLMQVPAYSRLDLRLGWRPIDMVELSFTAQNITNAVHQEWNYEFEYTHTLIPRSYHAEVTLRFRAAPHTRMKRPVDNAGDYIIEGIVQALIEIPKRPTLSILHDAEAYPVTSRLLLNSERLASVALEIALPVIEPAREKGLLRTDVELGLMLEWINRLLISYLSVPSATATSEDEIREQLRAMLLPALLG